MTADNRRRVVWFSCGAASAVAARVTLSKHSNVVVVYCDTFATEHPDNRRFFGDVERWLGVKIEIIRSDKYLDVDDVIERTKYMSGPKGARCTTELKKLPRQLFQHYADVHVFGFTSEEEKRADDFDDRNSDLDTEWPLISGGLSKSDCLLEIEKVGIALPEMYRLGFKHNNCIGCVKSSSSGYWNMIRAMFPDVFERRCRQSELLGVKLVRVNGKRVSLRSLPGDSNDPQDAIECGVVCQTPETDQCS